MWRGLRLTSSCQPVWCCCVAAQCVSNKRPRVVVRSVDVARLQSRQLHGPVLLERRRQQQGTPDAGALWERQVSLRHHLLPPRYADAARFTFLCTIVDYHIRPN